MTSSKALAVPVLLLFMCVPASARAQRSAQDLASARQLYNDGLELRDKGDMKGALEKFRAAHALGNTPLTGIELCRAHSALLQPVEAREVCLAVGRIPPLAEESSRSKDARRDAARLAEAERARIGALRVTITGVPAGRQPTVSIDGAVLPPAALNEPRAVNPGVHSIVASVGGGPETRATLETREGEARDLELAVQAPPEGEEPAPAPGADKGVAAPPAPPKRSSTFATASFVVAGISAGVGVFSGLLAVVGEGRLSETCDDKICGRDSWSSLDTARSWGTISTVSFVVAGAALGAGLISALSSRPSSASASTSSRPAATPQVKPGVTPVFGLGGAGLHGSF